jgi:hypothetical protein
MEYDSKTTSDFELKIMIGKSEVAFNAGDIKKIAEKGLHFKLPDGQTVELGDLKDFIEWLNEKFGTDLPDKADASWPTAIKNLLDGVLTTKVSVNQLTIDQDSQDADKKYPPLRFELSVNAKPTRPVDLAPGLSVTSVVVGVKQDYKKKDGTRGAAPTRKRR